MKCFVTYKSLHNEYELLLCFSKLESNDWNDFACSVRPFIPIRRIDMHTSGARIPDRRPGDGAARSRPTDMHHTPHPAQFFLLQVPFIVICLSFFLSVFLSLSTLSCLSFFLSFFFSFFLSFCIFISLYFVLLLFFCSVSPHHFQMTINQNKK